MPQPPINKTIGISFLELQSVDSTNNYARKLLHEGLAYHGLSVFAHEQVLGKGQRGKSWISGKDESIILSIIMDPRPLKLTEQFRLSACVAVAAHEFFSRYAGEGTMIKWPNDLYWQDRKAGGILIENVVGTGYPEKDRWQWAIAGIGININQKRFASGLKNPVSLYQITGKASDPLMMAKELCSILDKKFDQLIRGDFENIFMTYLSFLYKKNEKVKLKKGEQIFEVIILGISPSGKLIAKHSIEEKFDFGEIEWVL